MSYKVGDKVRIKTWDEMVNEFGTNERGNILIKEDYIWFKENDEVIPNDRIVVIDEIYKESSLYIIAKDNTARIILFSMIKGYVNEYYLQQIKDEL